MTTCTRCRGTGFLNLHQVPATELAAISDDLPSKTLVWMAAQTEPHDVQVCDCCGDGNEWHGTPGEHYGPGDLPGPYGPYGYNGGLCECH
jgi:hypothetical protein